VDSGIPKGQENEGQGTWKLLHLGLSPHVPRGSVLGPLLFLLFVNDLPSVIKRHLRMFADDTKIWRTIKDEIDSIRLQQDRDNMESWCQEWLLKLNPSKCKVMHIGHTEFKQVIMSKKRH